MFVHDAPSAAHLRQPNAYDTGLVPTHVPGDPTNDAPTEIGPEILGATVDEGAVAAGPAAVTGPRSADVADADPTRLVAVTTARTEADTSAFWSTYVCAAASSITAHVPGATHRYQV
jgi:hypothetical protein